MNRYDSLRKRNTTRLGAAAVLAVCVVLSGALFFARLAEFMPADHRHYIPLTRSRGLTTVQESRKDAASAPVALPAGNLLLTAKPGFQTTDKNTVWTGQTDIEIFSITYKNGAGQVTVNSSNGDRLLAPGTENTYEFALENTGNVPLEYTMDMEAYFSHEDYKIPVYARLTDHQGNYLVGTEKTAADVLELNSVSKAGTIAAGYVQPYNLHWEWPFELDDVYDTMLGNMAVDEDITLTIVIRTTASYTDTDRPGGVPQTGDTDELLIMSTVMVLSLAGLIVLLLGAKRKKEEDNG